MVPTGPAPSPQSPVEHSEPRRSPWAPAWAEPPLHAFASSATTDVDDGARNPPGTPWIWRSEDLSVVLEMGTLFAKLQKQNDKLLKDLAFDFPTCKSSRAKAACARDVYMSTAPGIRHIGAHHQISIPGLSGLNSSSHAAYWTPVERITQRTAAGVLPPRAARTGSRIRAIRLRAICGIPSSSKEAFPRQHCAKHRRSVRSSLPG